VLTSPDNYGRLDAENECNTDVLQGVPDDSSRRQPLPLKLPASTSSRQDHHDTSHNAQIPLKPRKDDMSDDEREARASLFQSLAPELIGTILSYLSPFDLVALSSTCHDLRRHAIADVHWQKLVQSNVPGSAITSAGPCGSFREVYAGHDGLWFLPRYKIWFCDRDLTGKLILVRYDQRRGCIEGYQMLAVSSRTTYEHWPTGEDFVVIHAFEPSVLLHLDKPVLQFDLGDDAPTELLRQQGVPRFAQERPMRINDRANAMRSNFMWTRPLDTEVVRERLGQDFPYNSVWPPPAIPARQHVAGSRAGTRALLSGDRPQRRSEVSDQTFQIRQWIEMGGTPMLFGQAGGFAGHVGVGSHEDSGRPLPGSMGVHLGEEIISYSTLDPVLYTPTPTKPWRGIWVGDYSGHGCEFLLVHQPDDPPASDADLGLEKGDDETDEEWEKRQLEARVYRGRLEGIKLTGDPNVPRGERTFVADDLGPDGQAVLPFQAPFAGVKVAHSRGHIARTGFMNDMYIESRLLLISHDRLAQYWVGFGHISYFERVNLDEFLAP
jgi:hypothetical protein